VTTVAVVDIGTNSTRLLLAEVGDGSLRELARESIVTRLGEGVDATGRLGDEPMERVFAALDSFAPAIERATVRTAVMTSAVRDAANGAEFAGIVRDRYGLEAATLSGDEEARLTSLGATATRDGDETVVVIDIGGGSTELVVGTGGEVGFYTSLQAGTVRHTERYLRTDPPDPAEFEALAGDVRSLIDAELTGEAIASASEGIAVAGTPTSLAAIDQELDPYDPERVHGHRLPLDSIQRMCSQLSSMTLEERLEVTGLHPGRAPTIVAGVVILIQVMRAFGLKEIEVSEHDILHGAALEAAHAPA
jgi:exopolyphosphatase/guanosine-5'-triphosphate,3'-diphosphate pyrophosphatase